MKNTEMSDRVFRGIREGRIRKSLQLEAYWGEGIPTSIKSTTCPDGHIHLKGSNPRRNIPERTYFLTEKGGAGNHAQACGQESGKSRFDPGLGCLLADWDCIFCVKNDAKFA